MLTKKRFGRREIVLVDLEEPQLLASLDCIIYLLDQRKTKRKR